MYCFIPPPLPPLFELPLLLLKYLCHACTLSTIPLMKQGLLCLTTAPRCRENLAISLHLLPMIMDHNLEGDHQKSIHILKVFSKIHLPTAFLSRHPGPGNGQKRLKCIYSNSPFFGLVFWLWWLVFPIDQSLQFFVCSMSNKWLSKSV